VHFFACDGFPYLSYCRQPSGDKVLDSCEADENDLGSPSDHLDDMPPNLSASEGPSSREPSDGSDKQKNEERRST
jgi:hypothetical protein